MAPLNEAEAGPGEAQHRVAPEERLRADLYALLSLLLRVSPDADTLNDLAALEGDDSELGAGLSALARAAGSTDSETVDDEFQALAVQPVLDDLIGHSDPALGAAIRAGRNIFEQAPVDRDLECRAPRGRAKSKRGPGLFVEIAAVKPENM